MGQQTKSPEGDVHDLRLPRSISTSFVERWTFSHSVVRADKEGHVHLVWMDSYCSFFRVFYSTWTGADWFQGNVRTVKRYRCILRL